MNIYPRGLCKFNIIPYRAVMGLICVAAAFLVIGLFSCKHQISSGEGAAGNKAAGTLPELVWLDDNTCEVTFSSLAPDNTLKSKLKEKACYSALLNCQFRMIEILREKYDKKLKEIYGDANYLEMTGSSWYRELCRIVRSGKVIHEQFEDPGCTVTYRIRKKGLKNWPDDLAKTLDVK